jgi:hypothetical protein
MLMHQKDSGAHIKFENETVFTGTHNHTDGDRGKKKFLELQYYC